MSTEAIRICDAIAAMKAGENIISLDLAFDYKTGKLVVGGGNSLIANPKFTINGKVYKYGIFVTTGDCRVDFGPMSQEKVKADKKKNEGSDKQFSTRVESAGEYGEFLMLLNEQWKEAATKTFVSGIKDGKSFNASMGDRKINPLIVSHYSENNMDGKAGEPLPNPKIYLKIDVVGKFSEKHGLKSFRGRTRTILQDAATMIEEENGVPKYDIATIKVDGEETEIDIDNVHQVLCDRCILKRGSVIYFDMATRTSNLVSMRPLLVTGIVDNSKFEADLIIPKLDVAPSSQANTTTKTTPDLSELADEINNIDE